MRTWVAALQSASQKSCLESVRTRNFGQSDRLATIHDRGRLMGGALNALTQWTLAESTRAIDPSQITELIERNDLK